MTTAELTAKLEQHYRPPIQSAGADGAAILREVTAPGGGTRRCDLLVVGIWQSRPGIDVHEVKVSHADFQRELDNPAKADAWFPYCDRFWIVAPDTTVAPPEMLPDGWGLMVPGRGRRFQIVVKPPPRQANVTRELLRLLVNRAEQIRLNDRQADEQRHRAEFDARVADALRERAAAGLDYRTKERLAALDELEAALGASLAEKWSAWGGKLRADAVGHALRDYIAGHAKIADQRDTVLHATERLVGDHEALLGRLRTAVAELRKDTPAEIR